MRKGGERGFNRGEVVEECGCKSAGVVVWRSVRDGGAQALAEFSGHAGQKFAWDFWRCFGLQAAPGQEKYALAIPTETTVFRESARQLPSGDLERQLL